MMKTRTKMLSEDDINITSLSTPQGYRDYIHNSDDACLPSITYRISLDNIPRDEPEDEWESISLEPLIYPEEQVSMCYE